jgi:hypothetical protein
MTPKQQKLLELLEAIDSLLGQDDPEGWLDAEAIDQLARMEQFVRSWLNDDSELSELQKAAVLADLTNALKPRILASAADLVVLH